MHALLVVVAAAVPVSGRVVDTEGKPVPNAKVVLSEPLTEVLNLHGRCDTEGRSITLTADGAGRFAAAPDFEVTSAGAEATDYVPLEAGGSRIRGRRITVTLRKDPFVELQGTVVDAANAPVEGARVSAAGAPREGVFSDAAGNFKLRLRASETGLWIARKGFEQRFVPRRQGPMKVIMDPRPTMAVYLVDTSRRPVTGFQEVTALDASGTRVGSCTTREAEGDCTLEGQLGDITVRATVGGKTVTQELTLTDTKKIDVTLQF